MWYLSCIKESLRVKEVDQEVPYNKVKRPYVSLYLFQCTMMLAARTKLVTSTIEGLTKLCIYCNLVALSNYRY